MGLIEFIPDAVRREHIAAYWILTADLHTGNTGNRIYADGCADIICNAGDTTIYFHPKEGLQEAFPLYPGKLYLGGTMTSYGVLKCNTGSLLTGIRFRPGGFFALFGHPMREAVDSTIPFCEDELCKLMQDSENMDARLNSWFNNRFTSGKIPKAGPYDFAYLRKRMYESGGIVSVETPAAETYVSQSTLERIPPKKT